MLSIDDILPVCDLDESKEKFNETLCSKKVDPLDCGHKKYCGEHTYCGIELRYNKKTQKLYERWLEQWKNTRLKKLT